MSTRGLKQYLGATFFGLLPMLIVLFLILNFLNRRFSGSVVGRGAGWLENAARGGA
jgi:hypothetical protein